MKTCPKCKELVGDNVDSCFNCNYNFILKRVPSYEETIGFHIIKKRKQLNFRKILQP